MKKNNVFIFMLVFITAVLISCQNNDPTTATTNMSATTAKLTQMTDKKDGEIIITELTPIVEPTPIPPFNREIFNRERQLWLKQNIQNYSFRQDYDAIAHGGTYTRAIIQNGKVYYRGITWDKSVQHESLLFLPPYEYGKKLLFDFPELYISISELYEQIEHLADITESTDTTESYSIFIEYDSKYHFPVYVRCNYAELRINDFVINPKIPEAATPVFDKDVFNKNLNKWTKQSKQNYAFEFSYRDHRDNKFKLPDEPSWWREIVKINCGKLSEIIPSRNNPTITDWVKAWIGTIDDVFTKIEKEANNYSDGILIMDVTYHETGYPKEIYYLKTAPNSSVDETGIILIQLVTEDELAQWK